MKRRISVLYVMLLFALFATPLTFGADRILSTSIKLKTPKKATRGDETLDVVNISMWVPEKVKVLRGVIVNPFYTDLVKREDYHQLARLWEFGLIGANFFGVRKDDYDAPLISMKEFFREKRTQGNRTPADFV